MKMGSRITKALLIGVDASRKANDAAMAILHEGHSVADVRPEDIPPLRSYSLDFPDGRLEGPEPKKRGKNQ